MVKSATRSELSRIRAGLAAATRGHHLLKDKSEELLRRVSAERARVRELRARAEAVFSAAMGRMDAIREQADSAAFLLAATREREPLFVEADSEKILSVCVPKLTFSGSVQPDYRYDFSELPPETDLACKMLCEIFPALLELAEAEQRLGVLSAESARTARRVNALESVIIPGYEEDRRVIAMKLEEQERGSLARILKSFPG